MRHLWSGDWEFLLLSLQPSGKQPSQLLTSSKLFVDLANSTAAPALPPNLSIVPAARTEGSR